MREINPPKNELCLGKFYQVKHSFIGSTIEDEAICVQRNELVFILDKTQVVINELVEHWKYHLLTKDGVVVYMAHNRIDRYLETTVIDLVDKKESAGPWAWI